MDKVATMKSRMLIYCLLGMALLLLGSCSAAPPTIMPAEIKIVSLKTQIASIQIRATQWYTDAYMVYAEIPIQISQAEPFLVLAQFQSLAYDNEVLMVTLELDGRITTKTLKQDVSVPQAQPIGRDDILIDSQAALNILLKQSDIAFMESHSPNCSDLSLTRDLAQSDQPVVWVLTVWDCGLRTSKSTFLNQSTGETGSW